MVQEEGEQQELAAYVNIDVICFAAIRSGFFSLHVKITLSIKIISFIEKKTTNIREKKTLSRCL